MIHATGRIADAFWRAAAYCLHPRVIALSLLPLLISAVLAGVFMYFFWEPSVAGVRATLESWKLIDSLLGWLDYVGASGFRSVMAPLVVLALGIPVVVVLSLLMVALLMTPAMVQLVAARRFPGLELKRGGSIWLSAAWSLGHTLLALLAIVVSMPFWFIPPLVLFIPPLIWGWLGYRVFAFDVLADHASAPERRQILSEHKGPLLALGLVTGYLGAAPAAIWAFGVLTIALAPLLVLVSVWLYTLVFAFTSLWFAHYALAALHELRQAAAGPAVEVLDPLPQQAQTTAAPPLLP
jgi:hypothetical protein